MKKPWVIGLLSILPGLGFLVLGSFKTAIILFSATSFLVLITVFVSWETLAITAATLALTLWITQGYYAVLTARRKQQEEAGLTLPTREIPSIPPPADATRGEKHLYAARQTVLSLLQPGEFLVSAVEGRTGTTTILKTMLGYGSLDIHVVYLAVTDMELLYITTDRLGKPENLQRFPFNQVTDVSIKETTLSDWMEIQLDGNPTLKVEIPSSSREMTRKLAASLKI